MKEEIKFKLGDRVYAPFHGYGVVTAIHEDACVYPIEVTWDDSGLKNMEDVSTFTADGLLSKYYANTDTILTVVKGSHKRNRRKEMSASKFKVGDRVTHPYHSTGTVTAIRDGAGYPIEVTWDDGASISYTSDGLFIGLEDCGDNDKLTNDKLTVVGNILPKEEEAEEEAKDNALKVGDRVWLNAVDKGTIVQFCPNEETCIVDSDTRGKVEAMIGALEKVEYAAVNPSHYRVEGIPEAIEIIKHLMAKEQLEGFLWGNILKYAYRYGRKGDKAETVGKIAWYAQKLKECESE